mgnify:FL=1
MQKERQQRAKEEQVIVLDFLKNGYASDSRPFHQKEPIIQVIGKAHFVLLELVAKQGKNFKPHDEVYIGDDERPDIAYIKGALPTNKLTQTAKRELNFIVEKLVTDNEKKYIQFYNNSGPISLRSHQLELLPGIGKRHAREILEQRSIEPFNSFDEIKERVRAVPNPKKAIIDRILQELDDKDRYKLFVRV